VSRPQRDVPAHGTRGLRRATDPRPNGVPSISSCLAARGPLQWPNRSSCVAQRQVVLMSAGSRGVITMRRIGTCCNITMITCK